MTDEQKRWLLDDTIIESIRAMPEEEASQGFSQKVLAGLEPKRPSLWGRFYLWLLKPKTLEIRPLQLAPVVVCLVAFFAIIAVKSDDPITEGAVSLRTVRFVLNDVNKNASQVSVIGSFNNWKAERSIMYYDSETEAWVLEAQLPPGDHEYLFLVNGEQLVPDPQAQLTRDDGFGNKNSIIFVNNNEQAL